MRNGGELIVEYLVREQVPYVFGVSGHGNVGLLDALYDRTDAIRTISTRHEQTAGHMADAYFRVAHRPAATLTSCGPGSCNIPIALACAFMDSSAFLAITANVPTSQFNRAPFQETYRHYQADFPSVIKPYVKRSWQPTRVDMLGRAKRPLIFVGHGVALSEAGAELTALARRLRVPVIFSPNGFGTLDMTDPLAAGFIGRNGAFPANEAARTCDVLLAVGVRFDDRSSSSWIPGYSFNIPPTRLIHVDLDVQEIGRNYPVHLGIVGDARTVLRQMLAAAAEPGPEPTGREAWLRDIAS